jgi:hypothetical protein
MTLPAAMFSAGHFFATPLRKADQPLQMLDLGVWRIEPDQSPLCGRVELIADERGILQDWAGLVSGMNGEYQTASPDRSSKPSP